MKRKKRRKPTRREAWHKPAVPISTVRLQREVDRLRELQDANAQSHTFPPPPAA